MKKGKLKFIIIASILIICLLVCLYFFMYYMTKKISTSSFVNQAISISENNENPIFRLEKIMLYISADAVDNSEEKNLKDISISQFTDIALYIDNTSYIETLAPENTIQNLWIDNIQITKNSEIGETSFNYKDIHEFGKYKDLEDISLDEALNFEVFHTNEEYENADYSNPTFYTDCTNPISLGFVNKDIVTNFEIAENSNAVSFNGKLLEDTNVDLNEASYNISFKIHIKNNKNEKFVYSLNINVALDARE